MCQVQFHSHLCAKCEIISKIWNIIFRQEYQALVERIVFTLHVCVPVKTETLPINFYPSHQNHKKTIKLSYKVGFLFFFLYSHDDYQIMNILKFKH